eukprot:5720647-Pleurochrysis_carterae.AAC.4
MDNAAEQWLAPAKLLHAVDCALRYEMERCDRCACQCVATPHDQGRAVPGSSAQRVTPRAARLGGRSGAVHYEACAATGNKDAKAAQQRNSFH